jgi:LPS export ABC transporter protein LptC
MLVVACQNEISDIKAITDNNNKPIQTSYNATYTFTEKGKKQYQLTAKQLDQYQNDSGEYIMASGGYTMVFFDSLENEEARLSAQSGRYTEKQKTLVAWDSVVLYNTKGEKLETSELIYRQDSASIASSKSVTITTMNGSIIRGRGLVSNESFTRYKILEPTGDLVVEDNVMNQFVAKQFFKKWNTEVLIANNGLEAIETLSQLDDIDLVLMDLQMPEMSGFEAAELIRSPNTPVKNRQVPIIALSADAFLETRNKVLEAGMNDFVTKPFKPDELYQKVLKYVLKTH